MPLPETDTTEGLPAALCEIVIVPDFSPTEPGTKVTVTGRLPPAATVADVGEAVNCGSDGAIFDTCKSAFPVLDMVSVRIALCPTLTLPNVSDVAES